MQLKSINHSSLQNMEHFQFAGHVLKMCKEAAVEKLTAVLPPLQTAIDKEDEALNLPNVLEGTKELEALDKERDKAYRSMLLTVEVAGLSDDDEAAAALKIQEVSSRYPRAAQENYDKESGMIKNLITDLKAAECTAAVTKLALTPQITRLADANEAFDVRFHARYKNKVPTGVIDIKKLRAATDAALNAVIRRIDSLDDLEPSAKIADLIRHYNNFIDGRRMLLSQRKATNKTATNKKIEGWREMLAPMMRQFETANNLAQGSLSFTGKTQGSGKGRMYELALAGSEKTIWVKVNKEHLVEVVSLKPKK